MDRHDVVLDAAVPVVVAAVITVVVWHAAAGPDPWLLSLGLAASAVLVVRRRAPGVALAVSGGLVLVLVHLDRSAGAGAVLAPAVALFSLTLTRSRTQQVVAGLAAVAAVVVADTLLGPDHPAGLAGTLGHVALVAVPVLAAEVVRTHRAYVAVLEERLALAERARHEEAQRRVEHERLRIARDLHDVIGHTLTTINVQAGVAGHLLDRQPGHARQALGTIEDASRDALAELRAIVGVLRDRAGDGPRLEPVPGLAAIEALVDQARRDGVDVGVQICGTARETVSDAVQLAAFRIVQESLTNARRHAPGTPITVLVGFEPDLLRLAITNPIDGAVNGTGGVGIVGMEERAAALGGRLQAGPASGRFSVTATLPYRGVS